MCSTACSAWGETPYVFRIFVSPWLGKLTLDLRKPRARCSPMRASLRWKMLRSLCHLTFMAVAARSKKRNWENWDPRMQPWSRSHKRSTPLLLAVTALSSRARLSIPTSCFARGIHDGNLRLIFHDIKIFYWYSIESILILLISCAEFWKDPGSPWTSLQQ